MSAHIEIEKEVKTRGKGGNAKLLKIIKNHSKEVKDEKIVRVLFMPVLNPGRVR